MIRLKLVPYLRRVSPMGFLSAALALLFHILPGVAPVRAQSSRKDNIVFNCRGIPLARTSVRVCAIPVSGQPCSLAPIYSDPRFTQALANPATADGLGNYFFYAADSKYMIEVSGPGITAKQIPNVILRNDPVAPTFSMVSSTGAINAFSLALSGNLTLNASTAPLGNFSSGVLNFTDQSTPPGAASCDSVNLYTKATDKKLYDQDDTGSDTGPLGLGGGVGSLPDNHGNAQCKNGSSLAVCSPNPDIDITAPPYNARAVSSTPATTCTISSGNNVAACGSSANFQVNDGVAFRQAGATNRLSTPSAPTVTPVLAGGPIGTGSTVAAPSGATRYAYKIAAADGQQGLTAASASASTATGPATLGGRSVSITSCSLSGQTVTCTTGSAHNLAVGAYVEVRGTSSDPIFGFWGQVATVPDTTHFTYTVGTNSAASSITSATGGTVYWWQGILVTLPSAPAGVTRYFIYGRTGGAFNRLGTSVPQNQPYGATSFPQNWVDFGSPMMDGAPFPSFVPATAPSSATNDTLVTTITAINGNNITLAANASNTVGVASSFQFDDAPALLAAISASLSSGGTVYIPAIASGTFFQTSSYISVPFSGSGIQRVLQAGKITFGDTIVFNSSVSWQGDVLSSAVGSCPQFSIQCHADIFGLASPIMMTAVGGGTTTITGVNVNVSNSGIGVFVSPNGAIPLAVFRNNNWVGTGAGDYTSIPLMINGSHSAGGNAGVYISDSTFTSGLTQAEGLTAAPLLITRNTGEIHLDGIMMNRRGLHFSSNQSGLGVSINQRYEMQGGIMPMFTVGQEQAGGLGCNIEIKNTVLDTMNDPLFAQIGTTNTMPCHVTIPSSNYPQPNGMPLVSGVPPASLRVATPNTAVGQAASQLGANTRLTIDSDIASIIDGTVGTSNGTPSGSVGILDLARPVRFGPLFHLYSPPPIPMAAPTCTVAAGGSMTVGTYTCQVAPVYSSGGEGDLSQQSSTVTTTSGNQTIKISWTAASGATGYDVYIRGPMTGGIACLTPHVSGGASTSTSFSANFTCNSFIPGAAGSGPSYINGPTIGTNTLKIAGGGFVDTLTGSFTANRAQSMPDAAGTLITSTVAETSALTGQVPTASNGGATIFTAPGVADGNSGSPVTTTPYTIQCDSSTALIDRVHKVRFGVGASVVNVPQSSASGCTGNFTVKVSNESGATMTFNRTGSDVFTVNNGSSTTTGTSFTLSPGQFASIANVSGTIQSVDITTGGVGTGAAPVMAVYISPDCPAASGYCFHTPADTQQSQACSWTAATPSTVKCGDQLVLASASVTSNVATYLFNSTSGAMLVPPTWTSRNSVTVTGFTGGDRFFNQTCTLTAVGTNSVSCPLTHANASSTSATGVVTNTNVGPFVASDVGKQVFGWASCEAFATSAIMGTNAITATGAPTIISFISSTQVQISTAANAQSGQTGCFVWGHPDDTAIATAEAAWVNYPFCPRVELAASNYLLTQPHFYNLPKACGAEGTLFPFAAGNVFYSAGFELEGRGTGNTVLYLTPNFPNGDSCARGIDLQSCFVIPLMGKWKDFQITGGSNVNGNLTGTHSLISGQVVTIENFTCTNYMAFANRGPVLYGITLGWRAQMFQVQNSGCGNVATQILANQGYVTAIKSSFENSLFSGVQINGPAGLAGNGYSFTCYDCRFFNSQNTNIAQTGNIINNKGGSVLLHNSLVKDGDQSFAQAVGYLCQTVGCVLRAYSTDFHFNSGASTNTSILCTAACTNVLQNVNLTNQASGKSYQDVSGSVLYDLGGNGFTTGASNFSINGSLFGTPSITGTACANGNWALTSGWGSSSIASVTAGGDSHRCQVVITGAPGSSGPVLTWTFPKAYAVAPGSCQISFNGTLTGESTGAPTTSSVAFTFTGTPSAQTYRLDASCGP